MERWLATEEIDLFYPLVSKDVGQSPEVGDADVGTGDIPLLKQKVHDWVHLNVGKNCMYNYYFFSAMTSSAQLSAAETVGNPIVLVSRMIA